MKLTVLEIEGSAHPLARAVVRHMNFGQHWRTPNVREVAYTLSLPHAYLRRVLDSEWPELIEDLQRFPDDDDDFEAALRAAGWPSPEEVLHNTPMARLALNYFSRDVLQEALGAPLTSGSFVVNTIDSSVFAAQRLLLTGRGAAASELKAYQDI